MAGKQKVDMVKMKCMSVRLGPHGKEGSLLRIPQLGCSPLYAYTDRPRTVLVKITT